MKVEENGEYRNVNLKDIPLMGTERFRMNQDGSDIHEEMRDGKFKDTAGNLKQYNMAIAKLVLVETGDEVTAFVGTNRTQNRNEFVVDVLKSYSDGDEFEVTKTAREYESKDGVQRIAVEFIVEKVE